MRGVVAWLDSTGVANMSDDTVMKDPYRWFVYGNYADLDSGWNFYGVARVSFGGCGNRGPQSACGMNWCVDREGKSAGYGDVRVPEGESPYVDPNNRDNLCPWLKGNGTVV